MNTSKVQYTLGLLAPCVSLVAVATDKPNILVVWGDDVGFWNLS